MDRRPARQTTLEQRALYSLPKVSKKKKVESKIIPSQEEVDRAIAAALAVQQTQFQTVLDNQKAHFENLLQQQPQNVLPPRPPITNHHIPIPKYDQESMTASYYLDEVETYFQSQGFGDNKRLYSGYSYVRTILARLATVAPISAYDQTTIKNDTSLESLQNFTPIMTFGLT